MILTATSRPSRRSRARYTVAMPPWPISSSSSYFVELGERSAPRAGDQRQHPPPRVISRQLLHPDRIRRAAHADARAVHHHEALAGLDQPVVRSRSWLMSRT